MKTDEITDVDWVWTGFSARLHPLLKYKIKCYNLSNRNFKRTTTVKKSFLYDPGVKSYKSSKSGQYLFCSIWRHMIYLDLFFVMSIILVQYNNILYAEKRQFQAQDNCESYFSLRSLSKKLQHLKVRSIFSLFKLTSQNRI